MPQITQITFAIKKLKLLVGERKYFLKKGSAFLFFLLIFLVQNSYCQSDSIQNKKTKKIILCSASAAATGGSLIYLNQLWYKSYTSNSFHFFNDNTEWLQMDKVGHAFSTYNTGRLVMQAMHWAGFSEKQSIFIGGSSGFAYMTAIEIMDGFSSGWGFSWGDMSANFGGSALVISQQYFWHEQRIGLKYSFHQTSYPQYRPGLLGSGLSEQLVKDYNGQTYWLSLNIASFLKKETRFPKWVNIALGYGAEGMVSGHDDFVVIKADGNVIGNARYRKYLLSFDVDLAKIKTRSHLLKSVFSVLNCVKIPFPAIELNPGGGTFHALYF